MDQVEALRWLRLLQLADSALPIGATAHSFGLETLVENGQLTVDMLGAFFDDYLTETGTFEAVYCFSAHRLGANDALNVSRWLDLNAALNSLKTARESRAASTALGRRFLQLALDMEDHVPWSEALRAAKQTGTGVHYCTAFGLVAGQLGFDAELTAVAYLRQMLAGLVSACQRLMPLGQTAASRLLWALQPSIVEAVRHARDLTPDDAYTFAPQVDVASLCHPMLTTRLFIS